MNEKNFTNRTKKGAKSTEMSQRLNKIRTVFCDDDNHKFAVKIGVSDQLASSICTGNKPAGKDILDRVLHAFPQVSDVWLKLGKGDMIVYDQNINADTIGNATIANGVSGNVVVNEKKNETESDTINRLLSLLESKDKQIDKFLAILEKNNLTYQP